MLLEKGVYEKYSNAILRSFPFSTIISQIKEFLAELKLQRLFIFFDDFSEIEYMDQRLFVDVILAPLNNSSDEKIKLKVGAYPERIYYGKIDPGKIDIINLDFAKLYKDKDINSTEKRAIEYTTSLIERRFEYFQVDFYDYFDKATQKEEYMRLLFESSFNVPRVFREYSLQLLLRSNCSRRTHHPCDYSTSKSEVL